MSKGKGGGNKNGDDILYDDAGQNVLKGGRGNDIYHVDSVGVQIEEKQNGGIDTVVASVDFALHPNVENLTLVGEGNLSGTGNELDNVIVGNAGDNTLDGGAGADVIDGGDGYDAAQFSGESSEYVWVWSEDELLVTDASGDTDILRGIEELVFDDQIISLVEPDIEPPPDDPLPPPTPEAVEDHAGGTEDNSVTIHVLANDTGSALAVQAVSNANFGIVTINSDNTLTYTPNSNANGTDVFEYTVADEYGQMSNGQVTVDVDPANDVPVAVVDAYATSADGTFISPHSVIDNDNDVDGDTLSVVSHDAASAQGGQVEMNADGTFSYVAPVGFLGTDTFNYTVGDGQGGENSSWVEIVVEETQPPEPEPEPEPEPDPGEPPYYVETLMAGDWYRLNANEDYGTGATVTFAFADATPEYYDAGDLQWNDFQPFDETQQANTKSVLDMVESFSGLTFVETSVDEAEIVFGFADIGSSGFAYFPTYDGVGKTASDVWLDDGLAGQSFESGTEAYTTLIHEIGHAMGLTHPDLPVEEETHAFTVMADAVHPTMNYAEPLTYMHYDVATLQHLYGANNSYANGDDSYTFDQLDGGIQALWDAGGHDTLDLSAATHGVDIDLRAGEHSTVSATGSDNLVIAYGTEIEDAIGSSFDDRLAGNELGNQLTGGDGNDVFAFSGEWGSDVITDFTKSEDRIDLTETGASYSDLEISEIDDGVLIAFGEESIFLADEADEIDEMDFIFL